MTQVILWHLKGDSEVLSWIGRKSSNTLRNLCRKDVLWGFTLQMCWKAVTRSLNLRQGKRKGTATWPNKRRANYVMKFPTKILPPPCNFWIKPHSSPCKTSHCSLWEEPLTHISLGKLYSEGTAQIPKHCWKKSSFQTNYSTWQPAQPGSLRANNSSVLAPRSCLNVPKDREFGKLKTSATHSPKRSSKTWNSLSDLTAWSLAF